MTNIPQFSMPKMSKIAHYLFCKKCQKSRYFCGRILARILRLRKVYELFHVRGLDRHHPLPPATKNQQGDYPSATYWPYMVNFKLCLFIPGGGVGGWEVGRGGNNQT